MNFTRVLQLSSRSLLRSTHLTSRSCRCLSTTTSSSSSPHPWFVDPSDVTPSKPSESLPQQPQQSATQNTQQLIPSPPLPKELSPSTPLARLHSKLTASPFLEPGTLLVTRPLPTEPGPPLPASAPKGRRKRGRSYVGEGLGSEEVEGALWQWVLIAEVRVHVLRVLRPADCETVSVQSLAHMRRE